MLKSIEGVYRDGKVELTETAAAGCGRTCDCYLFVPSRVRSQAG